MTAFNKVNSSENASKPKHTTDTHTNRQTNITKIIDTEWIIRDPTNGTAVRTFRQKTDVAGMKGLINALS